jgi:hypothetical protein
MNILFQKDSEEFVTITLYYFVATKNEKETLFIYRTKSDAPDILKDKLKTLTGKFKVPDFFTHNDIIKDSMVFRPDGLTYQSFVNYKENVIKKLLKEVDIENQKQKIDETNYGLLHPAIAEYLYSAFSDEYLNPVVPLEDLEVPTTEKPE